MLFNSFPFLFGFLPAVVAGAALLNAMGARRFVLMWLVAASLFFYGWWNPPFLILLVASVLVNFSLGRGIVRANKSGQSRTGWWLAALGVAANLAAIGWFKYAGFFAANVPGLDGNFTFTHIILPLGISFFYIPAAANGFRLTVVGLAMVDCNRGSRCSNRTKAIRCRNTPCS